MTENSYLCKLIAENPYSWRTICEEKLIRIKDDVNSPYAIFNYDIGADFTDLVVQEARGIIINIKSCEVVCWPFRKFGNWHEVYADQIDWSSAKVQEKIDGSIIKVWWDPIVGRWVVSTNGCIYAKDAQVPSGSNFYKLFNQTPESKILHKYSSEMLRGLTYIFELVGPENQVVVKYSAPKLFLIGIRENFTGEEYRPAASFLAGFIDVPKEYPLQSLEECVDAAKALNQNDYPDFEGFVVCDSKYNRIKVKSPEYLVWHHTVNNGVVTKELAYELINSDDFDLTLIKENIPEFNLKRILYYMEAFEQSKVEIEQLVAKVRFLSSLDKTRKEIAMEIKDDPKSYYGFKALDSGLSAQELIKSLGVNSFLKTIKDFSE